MSDHLHPDGPAVPQRAPSVMNRIVASSLRQRLLVILLTLALVVAGARSLDRLPVDAYPDLSAPMVEIIAQWPGHAAEEVERLITVPVEIAMNGISADHRHPLDLALWIVPGDGVFHRHHGQQFLPARKSSTAWAASPLPDGVEHSTCRRRHRPRA